MKSNSLFRNILLAAVMLTMGASHFQSVAADSDRQYFELRAYSTQSEQQQQAIVDHWKNAGIAAYNRLGIQPIGVFTELQDSPTNKIYVLIPYDSLETFASVPARLAADTVYQKAAGEYLNLIKTNAAFERIETSLLRAFDGMKQLAVPPAVGDRSSWVFELRTYLSPSENKGLNKIKMFNSGEVTVMKEVGLSPVFFGQTLAGSQMPCLTYMTCGENMQEHQKHWKGFSAAPVWKQLSSDPEYKDNMFGMNKVMLKRTAASQL